MTLRKSDIKICPLAMHPSGKHMRCVMNRCAWWSGEECAILALLISLAPLSEELRSLRKALEKQKEDK